jgi:hypothetical protein
VNKGFRGVLRVKGKGGYREIMIGLYLNYVRTRAFFSVSTNIGKTIRIRKL